MSLPSKSHIVIDGMEFSIFQDRYRQASQNASRAKFGSGTTTYEDLQNSSAFATENWSLGLAQTSAEAQGSLFAAGVDSRFQNKLLLGPRSDPTVRFDVDFTTIIDDFTIAGVTYSRDTFVWNTPGTIFGRVYGVRQEVVTSVPTLSLVFSYRCYSPTPCTITISNPDGSNATAQTVILPTNQLTATREILLPEAVTHPQSSRMVTIEPITDPFHLQLYDIDEVGLSISNAATKDSAGTWTTGTDGWPLILKGESSATIRNGIVPLGNVDSRLDVRFDGDIDGVSHVSSLKGFEEFWAYLDVEHGTSIKVTADVIGGGTIGTDTVVISTAYAGPQWHYFNVPNCLDTSAAVYSQSRLTLEPLASGDKFIVPIMSINDEVNLYAQSRSDSIWSNTAGGFGFISSDLAIDPSTALGPAEEPGFIEWRSEVYHARGSKIYRYHAGLTNAWDLVWDLEQFEVRSWAVFNNRLHLVGFDSFYGKHRHFVMLKPTDPTPAEMTYKNPGGPFTSMEHKHLLNWGGFLYAAGDYTIQYANCDETEWDTTEDFADGNLGELIDIIQTDGWFPHGFTHEFERDATNYEYLDGTAPNDTKPIVKKYDALGEPWLVPTDSPQALQLPIVNQLSGEYETLDTFGEQVVSTDFVINALAPLAGNRVAISTEQGMYVFEAGDISVPRAAWGSYSRENGLYSVGHKGELYLAADHRLYRFVESQFSSTMIDVWINTSEELPEGYIGPIRAAESLNNSLLVSVDAEVGPSVLAWTGEGWHSLMILPEGMSIGRIYFDRRNNTLFVATGRGFVFVSRVPDLTINPLRDDSYIYSPSGWIEYPPFFGALKELVKDCHSIYVTGENISETSPVDVYWKDDDSTNWEFLGTATENRAEIGWRVYETPTPLQRRPETREIQIGLVLRTDSEGVTPVVKAVRLKFHQNIEDFDNWNLVIACADHVEMIDGTPSPHTADEQRAHLDKVRKSEAPVWFQDLNGQRYLVEVRGNAIEVDKDSLRRVDGVNEYDSIHSLTLVQVEGDNELIQWTG